MDKETLNRANVLIAIIEQAENNIKNFEELFKASEIALSSKTKPHSMYISGKEKEEIKAIVIKKQTDFLMKAKEEFENL